MVNKKKAKKEKEQLPDVLNVYDNERLVSKFDKKNIKWPRVTKGSHLTVTEYESGKTELVWDDEALLNDVRIALASVSK